MSPEEYCVITLGYRFPDVYVEHFYGLSPYYSSDDLTEDWEMYSTCSHVFDIVPF